MQAKRVWDFQWLRNFGCARATWLEWAWCILESWCPDSSGWGLWRLGICAEGYSPSAPSETVTHNGRQGRRWRPYATLA